MPVIDISDLHGDPHLKAVGMFEPHEHPNEGKTLLARPPVRFAKTPTRIRTPAPRFGEHGEQVLLELGLSEQTVAELKGSGALLEPE